MKKNVIHFGIITTINYYYYYNKYEVKAPNSKICIDFFLNS